MKKSLKDIRRERTNYPRKKRLEKMPLGLSAIKCVEKVRQKTLKKTLPVSVMKWVEKVL